MGSVNVFETIAERRIREGREQGLFDDLPGKGRPIPDLGTERKPGWWAARVIKAERSMARAEELDRRLRRARPELWRLATEDELKAGVAELNAEIDEHNRLATVEHRRRLDVDDMVATWRRLNGD